MNLVNVDIAIEGVVEQIDDLTEVLVAFKTIHANLLTFNDKQGTNQALHDAGFNNEQINKFFEILTK